VSPIDGSELWMVLHLSAEQRGNRADHGPGLPHKRG
jgi:hypothetical protein